MMGTAIDWFRALGGSIAPELATLPPGESPAVAIRHSAPREWPTLAPDTISRQDGPSRSGRREFSASSCRGSRRRPAPPPHPATSSSKSCLLSNCGTLCPATSGRGVRAQDGKLPALHFLGHRHRNSVSGSKVIICLPTQRHNVARGVIEDCLGRMTELVVLEA